MSEPERREYQQAPNQQPIIINVQNTNTNTNNVGGMVYP